MNTKMIIQYSYIDAAKLMRVTLKIVLDFGLCAKKAPQHHDADK